MKYSCYSNSSLVLEVLYATKTLEWSIDHDGQPRAQSLALLHAVRGEDNAPSLLNNASQHIPEVAPCGGIHASGGLVQQNNRRITNKSNGCAQLTLVTTTVGNNISRSISLSLSLSLSPYTHTHTLTQHTCMYHIFCWRVSSSRVLWSLSRPPPWFASLEYLWAWQTWSAAPSQSDAQSEHQTEDSSQSSAEPGEKFKNLDHADNFKFSDSHLLSWFWYHIQLWLRYQRSRKGHQSGYWRW